MRSLLVIFLLVTNAAVAQRGDSLLHEVEVYGIPIARFRAGAQINLVDSSLTKADQSASLSDVISLQLPIYFRNYGNGMISGISLRGTSPQHTAILWNGININSFSLGQADFSILPANAFGEITVHEGGGSAQFGSGAFGGAVLLNSQINNSNQNTLAVTQQAGSFSKISTSVSNQMFLKRLSLGTRLYSIACENDFPVENFGRQPHASFWQRGLLQDVEYNFSNSKSMTLHYWVHRADREVQPSIGQTQSNDEQQDLNHRLNIEFKNSSAWGYTHTNAAYIKDVLVFNNNRSDVSRFVLKGAHQYKISEQFLAEIGGEWNHISTAIPEYGSNVSEERFDVVGGLIFQPNKNLSTNLSLRKPFVEGFTAPLLPYVGADYTILQSKHQLKASVNGSMNYRVPTLNDRYWQDAGSLDLQPEKNKSAEVSLTWKHRGFSLRSTFHKQRIDQWIQWVPGEGGMYRPRNVKEVSIEGVQGEGTWAHKFNATNMEVTVNYQDVRSIITSAPPPEYYTTGKQLIYTPQHTAVATIKLTSGKYYTVASLQYYGKRFSDSANTDLYALDRTMLANLIAGYYWSINSHTLIIDLTFKNIFDQRYQMYAGNAMPGRNYSLQLTYKLNYKKK
jgi:vitamin B12 transporter